MEIRSYVSSDEVSWVRCRVLSFLDTAYYDNVLTQKETYNNPSIELVAIENNQVVGLIDIEYDTSEQKVCSHTKKTGGMIWHIATHPDYQRMGVGSQLLVEAEKLAAKLGINYFEAWTRDDEWVRAWYRKSEFTITDAYYHVYFEGHAEVKRVMKGFESNFTPEIIFAHYNGDDPSAIEKKSNRIHECVCFIKNLKVTR
ncbi:GNAT family N-acetyltransferase [Alkalicoccobacillus murimartini]|uniref:Ribosomal protein S18 acetylase RimI-like enzyme n=1 Tax=Alkalicoccobacillus murimartini TaxID=171685 RepID=A0ABT9YME8_9BACI|nr:GNAT family N-acetyltransferase [Alkalicoccobacillus murimartini]MDQ0208768.1 ribosomal protein S18 acetylase RimI-like enzyme [Alkalicoccobacillus murimartini]